MLTDNQLRVLQVIHRLKKSGVYPSLGAIAGELGYSTYNGAQRAVDVLIKKRYLIERRGKLNRKLTINYELVRRDYKGLESFFD